MRQLLVPAVLVLSLLAAAASWRADGGESGHSTKIYVHQGGATQTFESGSTLNQESGATGTLAGANTVPAGGSLAVDAGGKFTLPVTTTNVSLTVTAAQSGTTFVATAEDCVFTLPATANGLTYTFTNSVSSTSVGVRVSPAAADKIYGNGFTPLDDKDAINTPATDREGDAITIVGDGSAGWFIRSVNGTWARE